MHLFKTHVKILLRNRALIFWTLLFPIILSGFFRLTFANIQSGGMFNTINIAVIENDFPEHLLETLETVNYNETTKMFNPEVASKENALELLENDQISGIIEVENNQITLTLKYSGLNATILKTFLDEYLQISSTVESIIVKSEGAVNAETILAEIANQKQYISQESTGLNNPNLFVNYFFALIGMAILYGGYWGTQEIVNFQANLSYKGMRISVSPVNRFKLLMIKMGSSFLVHFSIVLIFLAFIQFVLGVSLGTRSGLIVLVAALGSLVAIWFGAFIGISLKKANNNLKMAITSIVGVFGGMLSGMMSSDIKYWVLTNAPFLGYINPVNLITDGLYSLYYFPTLERFLTNILILCVMLLVFVGGTFLNFRRDSYESL